MKCKGLGWNVPGTEAAKVKCQRQEQAFSRLEGLAVASRVDEFGSRFPRDGAHLCLDWCYVKRPLLLESGSYSWSPQGPPPPTSCHSLHTPRSSLPYPLSIRSPVPLGSVNVGTSSPLPSPGFSVCFPLVALSSGWNGQGRAGAW